MRVYDVKPVANDHGFKNGPFVFPGNFRSRIEVSDNFTQALDRTEKWGGVGKVHAIKYAYMCYGNREDAFLHTRSESDRIRAIDTTSITKPRSLWQIAGDNGDLHKRIQVLVRSLLLETWEREVESHDSAKRLASRSICACMDDMQRIRISDVRDNHLQSDTVEGLKNEMLATLGTVLALPDNHVFTWVRDYLKNTLFSRSSYDALALNAREVGSVHDSARLAELVRDMRVSNIVGLDYETSVHAHYADEDMDDIWRFCNVHAAPTYTMDYLGPMSSWHFIILGQLVLAISCILSFQISWSNRNKNSGDGVADWEALIDPENKYMIIWHVGRGLLYLLPMIWAFVHAGQNDQNVRIDWNKNAAATQTRFDSTYGSTLFIVISGVVCGAVVIVEWVTAFWYSFDTYKKDVLHVRVVYALLQDLPNIAALGLLAVGVLLQNGVKDYQSILLTYVVVIATATIQHVSNLIGIFFDAFVSTENNSQYRFVYDPALQRSLKSGLSTNALANLHSDGNERMEQTMKGVLLRMCYVRSGVFMFVVLVTLFLIGRVGVTLVHTGETDVRSMHVVLFAIIFFGLLCGFDFFYELFNIESDEGKGKRYKMRSIDKRWLHNIFVFIYIAFVNFIVVVQVW